MKTTHNQQRRTEQSPFTILSFLLMLQVTAQAADPGSAYPANAAVSDQKAGSLLVYNVYTSSVTDANNQNTHLTITNTSATAMAYVHLFFVDGTSCAVADSYICLTANQTACLLASDLDPGVTGFVIAVAVSERTGCPVGHNFLLGQAEVKFADGHQGDIAAEAFAAQFDDFPDCGAATTMATLAFGQAVGQPGGYNSLPRVLALSNIGDRASGNDTLLVINRIGGNLAIGTATIGAVFGILYDDAENAFSFGFNANACQFRSVISNNFPRTTPRFENAVPAGRSGWLKLWADNAAVGLLGAAFNRNPNSATAANAFNGGHNLHKLRLNDAADAPSLTIPIFPPSC